MAEKFKRPSDPLLGFRFTVKESGTGEELAGFSNVSGLEITIETEKFQEGGSNEVYSLPKGIGYSNLVLKKGLADEKLWDWYKKTLDAVVFGKKIPFKNLILTIYDNDLSTEKWILEFIDAFPVKWSGSELNGKGNNIIVETLEIAHRGVRKHGK